LDEAVPVPDVEHGHEARGHEEEDYVLNQVTYNAAACVPQREPPHGHAAIPL
jgi:hypothetical protein